MLFVQLINAHIPIELTNEGIQSQKANDPIDAIEGGNAIAFLIKKIRDLTNF